MAIFIKIVLIAFFLILGFGGYFITQDFFRTITTEDYRNSSLFGRFITKVIWGSVAVTVVAFEIMIVIAVFSKLTVG